VTAPTDRTAEPRAVHAPAPPAGAEPTLVAPVPGVGSPTPAAGMGVPAAGPDPISRWGGEGGPDNPGKGGPPKPRVIGLDLSLAATGLALANGDTEVIRTAPGDHLADQHDRLTHIVSEIIDRTRASRYDHPAVAVIEGPSYNSSGAGTWDRAGLWWLTVARLFALAVPVAIVPPAALKRYATGKGTATKPDMRMALYQRAGLDLRDDNQVDAWWLRAMGLDHLGYPPTVMPATNRAALDKVRWPEGIRT